MEDQSPKDSGPVESKNEPNPVTSPTPEKGPKGIGSELARGGMPKPSEHLKPGTAPDALEGAPQKGAKKRKDKVEPLDPARWAHLRDGNGRAFDPGVHFVNPDGSPRLTSKGNLWPRPGPKPKDTHSRVFQALGPDAPADHPDLVAAGNQYRAAAEATVDTIVMTAVMFGGEDWALGKTHIPADLERANMVNSYERLFRERGMMEPPWWVGLAVAHAHYVLPRIAAPSTKKRAGLVRQWLDRLKARKKSNAEQKRDAQEQRAKEESKS